MKLKTNNAAPKSANTKINKSPKKQGKGVEVRKEKSKVVVKPEVLKKEAVKAKVDTPPSPHKLIQQELWGKAIVNVSNLSTLSDEESSIAKLLADYKKKSSIPFKSLKFRNFITKGFSKFKDTSIEVADGIYEKILSEYKSLGGVSEANAKKTDDKKVVVKKTKKVVVAGDDDVGEEDGDEEEDEEEEEVVDAEDDDKDDIDADEDIVLDASDDDIDNEEESDDEKPKPKAKVIKINNKNGKGPNKGNKGSKFKGGKVQKNKKFGKKK
ncbi:Hypothetical protein CINCED_3A009907 [Cinara cedri]|uniref:Uncharacterized protein n=1 Tax=Cinara cedri TaxID=506608 RepID=A0A5E4NBZ4_9HEMI|nr:Hypothetical protein CINCED_3A009907 [Cinara cedri]